MLTLTRHEIFKSSVSSFRSDADYRFTVHDYHGRFKVETLVGGRGSRLVIRNFRKLDDDGLYRCFATRTNRRKVETVFMEVDVQRP